MFIKRCEFSKKSNFKITRNLYLAVFYDARRSQFKENSSFDYTEMKI